MKFEVEHKEYIKVDVDDVDVLSGAIKILKKRLSSYLLGYNSFCRKDGKIIGRYAVDAEPNWGVIKEVILAEKFPKISDRDIRLIETIINLTNESCRTSTDRVL